MRFCMAVKMDFVNSLEKILPSRRPRLLVKGGEMLANEKFAFQVSFSSSDQNHIGCQLKVQSPISDRITVRKVDYVMGLHTLRPDHDGYILGEDEKVFPDILRPPSPEGESVPISANTVFWVDVHDEGGIPAGEYEIKFFLYGRDGALLAGDSYILKVLSGKIARENGLILTNWLHSDCICEYYGLSPMSDGYFSMLKKYMECAARHGLTMVYVPLFTPPLDTKMGGERLTVQTVDVKAEGGTYSFGFEKLDRYIDTAISCGIKYFELSHLFTQWGAEFCPKVMAHTQEGYKRIFGWEDRADGERYRDFLAQLLPKLTGYLERKGIAERSFIHISDEPNETSLSRYGGHRKFMKQFTKGIKYMDALSHFEFYGKGYVDLPAVSLSAVERFSGVKGKIMVYNCCSEYKNFLSNKFLNMPSLRTRVLGIQLYRNRVRGYLNWGFNFYNSALSLKRINPFLVTDADGGFQAGDPFVVYPGSDGPLDSLRLELFFHSVQDYNALLALEQKMGRNFVDGLLERHGFKQNFTDYPREENSFLKFRSEVNRLLSE